MAAETGTRSTVTALGANIAIAVAKFIAFAATGSASMLAESIHSVADSSNQVLLLVGIRRARRPPSVSHPFGYGRERYFWSFMVAVLLFTMGAVFSVYEGTSKLRDPHEVTSIGWAVGVLSVAIVFEAFSLRIAVGEANQTRTQGWWDFVRQTKSPEVAVLLLEDTGALLGLVFALAGVSLAAVTDNPRFDAFGSLAIGVLLGVIAIVLAIELRSLLLGEGASSRDLRAIEETITGDPDVRHLIHIRTEHVGPDQLLVAAKIELRPELTFSQVADVINRIEERVRARLPNVGMIYLEPDVAR